MIEIKERIELEADRDAVWAILSDPHQVVDCIPGAELVSENEDGSYDGKLTVHFGPMRVGFRARVGVEFEHEQHHGKLTARGKDNHGATRMRTEAEFEVSQHGELTLVELVGEVQLSGRLASTIENGAAAVVRKLSSDFTTRLTAKVSPEPEPVEVADTAIPGVRGLVARVRAWLRSWRQRRRN
jgi:carbon monoxide dehydrogenase subunit G